MKNYLVEVKVQISGFAGSYSRRAGEWSRFEEYRAESKADAIKQARAFNRMHCQLESDHGLCWFRAKEIS